MLARILLAVSIIFVTFYCHSQTRQLTGRVVDSETQKPVANAAVIIYGTTQGTFTNHLGFFELNLESSYKALIISCIGYEVSRLEVPSVNQFKVQLKREYRKIVDLDLEKFQLQTLPPAAEEPATNDAIIEKDAYYLGGWDYFFNDVGQQLKTDALKDYLDDSVRNIRFTVGRNGKVSKVMTYGDSAFSTQVLFAFQQLNGWRTALQNKQPVEQHFQLPVIWGKRDSTSFKNEVFTIVEEPAQPVGGMREFYHYINKELRMPSEARRRGVSGRVFVEFVIKEDGTITDVQVVKGIGYGCDEEAVRVISAAPGWTPGRQRSKPVKQRMVMPITFHVDGGYAVSEKSSREAFASYMSSQVRYPIEARRMGIEGWVIVRFVVDRNSGELRGADIVKDIEAKCGEVVLEALKAAPPALLRDLPSTRDVFVLPVGFGLDSPLNFRNFNYVGGSNEENLDPLHVIALAANRPVVGGLITLGDKKTDKFLSFNEALRDPDITRVSITNKEIQTIPVEVKKLTRLLFLDLEGNKISVVPTEICDLKKLQELYLSSNSVSDLPAEFSRLKSLRILALANNQFTKVPESISQLTRLEGLDLAGNQLAEIPPVLKELKNLKALFLQNNKIEKLPKELAELKSLQRIYLAGNPISPEEREVIKRMLLGTEVHFE